MRQGSKNFLTAAETKFYRGSEQCDLLQMCSLGGAFQCSDMDKIEVRLTCALGACWAVFVVMSSAVAVLQLRSDLGIFHLLSFLVGVVPAGGLVLRLLESTELFSGKLIKHLSI